MFQSAPEDLGRNLSFYSIPLNYGLPESRLSDDGVLNNVTIKDSGWQINVDNELGEGLTLHLVSCNKFQTDRIIALNPGEVGTIDKTTLPPGIYILSVYNKTDLKDYYKFTIR